MYGLAGLLQRLYPQITLITPWTIASYFSTHGDLGYDVSENPFNIRSTNVYVYICVCPCNAIMWVRQKISHPQITMNKSCDYYSQPWVVFMFYPHHG